jgi:hypothetical protein
MCTLVQALRLCTGRTAHRRSRGIALPFLDHGTRREWGVSVTPRPLFTPGKDPVPIVQEAGCAQGRSGQVRKISPPTAIRSPDCPARSQSLYQLRYPAHKYSTIWYIKQTKEYLVIQKCQIWWLTVMRSQLSQFLFQHMDISSCLSLCFN